MASFWGCVENKRLVLVNRYKYFEATLDDIPQVNKIEAIAILNHSHPEVGQIMLLVGNQKNVEKIIGHEINPQKVVDDRKWIEKLATDFKNAKRCYIFYKKAADYSRGDLENAHVVFITKNSAYMIPIRDTNGEFVSGPGYESKELKKDFDELGLD
jgi:hypothetical protein